VGKIARHFADEAQDMQAAFEEVEQAWGTNDMWIGLMNSAVVGFAERPGGGQLIFVALLDKSLTVEGTSSDGNDYSPNRELLLTLSGGTPYERGYKLTSPYPAALVAFEKKLLALREIRIKEIEISDRVKEEARSRIP
jgi:hypothetical protein